METIRCGSCHACGLFAKKIMLGSAAVYLAEVCILARTDAADPGACLTALVGAGRSTGEGVDLFIGKNKTLFLKD